MGTRSATRHTPRRPLARLARVSEQNSVSEIFDPTAWDEVPGFDFTDITYHRAREVGAVRVAFHRPEVLNAFRPHTVDELYRALDHARMAPTSAASCSPATDLAVRHRQRGQVGLLPPVATSASAGVRATSTPPASRPTPPRPGGAMSQGRRGRLHILEVAAHPHHAKDRRRGLNGWAGGRRHSLHVVCDLTSPSREHARSKQTDADVGLLRFGGYAWPTSPR